MEEGKFIRFKNDVTDVVLPCKFTFPFYYEPHPIALAAVEELQDYLTQQSSIHHDFGLDLTSSKSGQGKMFGVLVVESETGELGYLAGFSGKLGDSSHHVGFVPPIFDLFNKDGYFAKETIKLEQLISELSALKKDEDLRQSKLDLEYILEECATKIKSQKHANKEYKKDRVAKREKCKSELSSTGFSELLARHKQESLNDQFLLKEYSVYLESKVAPFRDRYEDLLMKVAKKKQEMQAMSAQLQTWLFAQYNFLNIKGVTKNVIDIFANRIPDVPPSGAGDCAAPKLLQFAFLNKMKPISMAEFWWGASPESNSRKHKYFYPACRGKCEPILNHMLEGITLDQNPLLENHAVGKEIDILYEDEYVLVINKPEEFLSVPGKMVTDSVQERMKAKYPDATGPMIVHRLDMSTSGLMVVAKEKDIHKAIQKQFNKRLVKKRYVAILDGSVKEKSGYINLPHRVDLDNRPYQILCYEYGKSSRTKYQVVEISGGRTRIHFFPITGRTHQLRFHASHHLGLDAPILGDDLYGQKGTRLHLHAEEITFVHPIHGKEVKVISPAPF